MEIPDGVNNTNSPTTDSDTESLELAQVYVAAATNRGPVASMQRPHRPVFDRSANGTVVSPVEGASSQPVRVPALVPNIRVSNFGVALPNQTTIAKPTVTDSGFIREDREPRDLKQALQYSLSLCDGNSPIKDTTEENKSILNEVISSCFSSKPSVLRQRLEFLRDVKDVESEKKTVIDCLEAIEMEVELTDQANDFCNKDGMKALSRYVFSDVMEIRIAALNILATVVQNNPIGMKKAFDEGILNLLTSELVKIAWSKEINPDKVAVKSLYALSCLLRGNPEGCKFFKENAGFNNTMAIVSCHHDPKLLKKCYYIIVSLIADELELGQSADISHIETEPWKLYMDMILERFVKEKDSIAISTTMAQVLEQICIGYWGRSSNFKIADLMMEKGVLSVAQSYIASIDETCGLDLEQDEVELFKTCKALLKFLKPVSVCDEEAVQQEIPIEVSVQDEEAVPQEIPTEPAVSLDEVESFLPSSELRECLEVLRVVREAQLGFLDFLVIDCLKKIRTAKVTDPNDEFFTNGGVEALSQYVDSCWVRVRKYALTTLVCMVKKSTAASKQVFLEKGILRLLADEMENLFHQLINTNYTKHPKAIYIESIAHDTLLTVTNLLRDNTEGCQLWKEKQGFILILQLFAHRRLNHLGVLRNCLRVAKLLIADEIKYTDAADDYYSDDNFIPWIYAVESIVDRFTVIGVEYGVMVILAQLLEQICLGYIGRSKKTKIVRMLKEKNVPSIANINLSLLDGLAQTGSYSASGEEKSAMAKACKALLKYTE